MSPPTSTNARWRSALGVASLVTGILAVLLAIGGQLVAARTFGIQVNAGHPEEDSTQLISSIPSATVAVLAIALGVLSLWVANENRRRAAWGITAAAVALFCILTGVPVWLLPNPWTESLER